jgi:muramoyltetrapeptide carboxypeptidase
MIGTEYDIDSKGKLIFLEEIGEEPYRIDRMLTQMRQSGKFEGCKGLALGVFERCEAKERDPEFPRSLTLKQVLKDRLGDLGIPVIYGLSFGHITNKFTLPFGIKAKLDTYNKRLTLLEEAVK